MPLWGNVDNAANSVISLAAQENLPISTGNRTVLFGNTTPNVITQGITVGQFGVDANEQQAAANNAPKGAHAGWQRRVVGQGGRSGRVSYETLVAMGSMSGDASDDTQLPDQAIIIRTQPAAVSAAANTATSFFVDAYAAPAATLTYQWQRNGANIADAGVFSGAQTPTLSISNTTNLQANSFGAIIYAGGVNRITSNAVLTIV
jgi:hypothetical protein